MERQLMKAGNELLLCAASASMDQLFKMLHHAESILSKVEQSLPGSILEAVNPLINALSREDLLNHSDMDIRVVVASCMCEILRITAPEVPFDDEKTKIILGLILSCLKDLSDSSSHSYNRRIRILETFNNINFGVVMLDLECDLMIDELFQTFSRSIRDFHPNNIFSSMVDIITLLLQESETISLEMISPLLVIVKLDNQDVLPAARRLVERVFQNCATKLKPILMKAAWFETLSFDNYNDVVGDICGVVRVNNNVGLSVVKETSENVIDQGVDSAQVKNIVKVDSPSKNKCQVLDEDHPKEDACEEENEDVVDAISKRQRKKKIFFDDVIECTSPFISSRGRKHTKNSSNNISSTNDKKEINYAKKKSRLNKDKEDDFVEKNCEMKSKTESTSTKGKEVVISKKPSFELLDKEDGLDQTLMVKHNTNDVVYDKSLIKSRIKIWWPTHMQFYECVICCFDSVSNKYKVLYDDLEVESLTLQNEIWDFVEKKTTDA